VKKKKIYLLIIPLILLLYSCATTQNQKTSNITSSQKIIQRQTISKKEKSIKAETEKVTKDEKKEMYLLKEIHLEMKAGKPYMPVGAEIISKDGKVPLIEVIKKLAELKGFSVSWADDVDPELKVDVNIRAADNFWDALDNVLRQVDYFYEMKGETIVIRFKETKKYRLVMPPLSENFSTALGGNLIGTGAKGMIKGETSMSISLKEPTDFWKMIEDNIKKIIESVSLKGGGSKGYFITDPHLGIITVTAPKKTHKKIEEYLNKIKEWLYREVVIEAKIVEVELSDTFKFGIDWSDLLSRTLNLNVTWGEEGNIVYRHDTDKNLFYIRNVTMNDQSFQVFIDALKTYGKTKVLSSPKVTILNGHMATITVGENITYLRKVTTTTETDTGTVTFNTEEASVLSGVGMAVMANIINDKEVILYIVPITSALQEPIEKEVLGSGANEVKIGLPRVRIREMATLAKVKDGDTLIIGGHIDRMKKGTTKKVPLLGDIPIFGWFFKHRSEEIINRELIIFLKPTIITSAYNTMGVLRRIR